MCLHRLFKIIASSIENIHVEKSFENLSCLQQAAVHSRWDGGPADQNTQMSVRYSCI